MAGSTWPSLTAGQPARAADVESKFDWIEGALMPMSGGAGTTGVHDLGTTTAVWNNIYGRSLQLGSQSIVPAERIHFEGTTSSESRMFLRWTAGNVFRGVMGVAIATDTTYLSALAGDMVFQTFRNIIFGANSTGPHLVIQTNGSVVIGTSTAHASTILDIDGSRAVRLPRITTINRDALTGVEGLMIYNSTTAQFEIYQNGAWRAMSALIGARADTSTTINNSGATTASTDIVNFIGGGRIRKIGIISNSAGGGNGATTSLDIIVDSVTVTAIGPIQTTGTFAILDTATGYYFPTSGAVNPGDTLLDMYFRTSCRLALRSGASVAGSVTGWASIETST